MLQLAGFALSLGLMCLPAIAEASRNVLAYIP